MTTIVTRLYEDAATARAVIDTLSADGFPASTLSVVEQSGKSSAQSAIEAAGVPEAEAQAYAQHLSSGRGLLVVRAPIVPFGAARRAIEVANSHPSVDAGVAKPDINRPDQPDPERFLSILGSHRKFFTADYETRSDTTPRGLSRVFGIPTLAAKEEKRMRPALIDQRFGDFLFPLLARNRKMTRIHLINAYFARFALPHLTRHKRPRPMIHGRLTN